MIKDRKFIEDQELVKVVLKKLKRIDEQTPLDGQVYINLESGQKWEKYEFDKIEHLRISGIGLRLYPYPETSEIIEIALNSEFYDEIESAARLLYRLEYLGIEFREKLLNELEQRQNEITKEKFDLIYFNANLFNSGNLRDILNKSVEEVSNDYNYYLKLFKRAETLRKKYDEKKITGANTP